MRLIDRLAGSRSSVAEPGQLPEWSYYYSTYASNDEQVLSTFESYARDGYGGNGVVFGILLARLMLFSEAEFKYQNLADKRLFGDESLMLLENPWPGGTTGELLARMEQDASLAGNCFIRNAGDRLERMRPDWVDFIAGQLADGSSEVIGYRYRRNNGVDDDQAEVYPVDEVAHWSPIPDPLARWRGMSWLTPVVREINADTSMTTHKRAFFDNAGTPNMIIKYQTKVEDSQIGRLVEQWNARHAGPMNSGKTAVLDMGADPVVIGHSFEQMSFAAVQAAGENRIAAAAGVPGIVVGLKEGLQAATYSNYEQAMRRFADITMRPNWRSACACLAKLVDAPDGSRLWYDASAVAALRQGEKERAETFKEKAFTATELIRGGYDPETVAAAVEAGDLSLLKHTGAIPTALYPEGKTPDAGG